MEPPAVPLRAVLEHDGSLHQDLVRVLGGGGPGILARWRKVAVELSKEPSLNKKLHLAFMQELEDSHQSGLTRATAFISTLTDVLGISAESFILALRQAHLDVPAEQVEQALAAQHHAKVALQKQSAEGSLAFDKRATTETGILPPSNPICNVGTISPFVGRAVDEIVQYVADGRNVISFVSDVVPGGSGKSEYARMVAIALRKRFRGHVLEVPWESQLGSEGAMRQVLRILGKTCEPHIHPQTLYKTCFSSELCDCVLLFDGLSSQQDIEKVASLLPGANASCCVLITSRVRLTLPCQVVEVGTLSRDSSVELLRQLFLQNRPDINVAILPRLAACCADIALALSMIAGHCLQQHTRSAESVCKMLEDSPQDRLAKTTLDKCFEISYNCLQAVQQTALSLAAVWGIPFEEGEFMKVFNCIVRGSDTASVLHELASSALLKFKAGSFQMHEVVREYVLTRVPDPQLKSRWRERITRTVFLPILTLVDARLVRGDTENMRLAMELYSLHRAGLENVVQWCIEGSLPRPLVLLAAVRYRGTFLHFLVGDLAVKLYERTTQLVQPGPLEMQIRRAYGTALSTFGKYADAQREYSTVLKILAQAPTATRSSVEMREAQLEIHFELARLLGNLGNRQAEVQKLREVLQEQTKLYSSPFNASLLRTQFALAFALHELDQKEEALNLHKAVLKAQLNSGMDVSSPHVLSTRHELACLSIDADFAEKEFREIAARKSEIFGPQHRHTADTEAALGLVLLERNQTEEAVRVLKRVVETRRHIFGSQNSDTLYSRLLLVFAQLAEAEQEDVTRLQTLAHELGEIYASLVTIEGEQHPNLVEFREVMRCTSS